MMMIDFGSELNSTVILFSLMASVAGSLLTFFAMRGSAKIRSAPDYINSLWESIDKQDRRIKKLEEKQEVLEKEISSWKRNYFKLLAWLKEFFKKNGINEVIPEFHKVKKS